MTLVESEISVYDLDTFCLEIDGPEDRCAHDTDCADDRFREEEPDRPGYHRGDKSPYIGNLARLVTGKGIESCDFPHPAQTMVEDYTWSALLGEPEANEDSPEGHCSNVKDPGPEIISGVVPVCSTLLTYQPSVEVDMYTPIVGPRAIPTIDPLIQRSMAQILCRTSQRSSIDPDPTTVGRADRKPQPNRPIMTAANESPSPTMAQKIA